MPASLKRTREHVEANTRTLGKSLELTIKVKAYENGMVEVYGVPINDSTDGYDAGHGWLGAAEAVTLALGEFRRRAAARQKARAGDDHDGTEEH